MTEDLRNKSTAKKLLNEYESHKNDIYYKSVMDIIVRANKNIFKEEKGMNDVLWEIFEERIRNEMMSPEVQQQIREERQEAMREGRKEGLQEGRKEAEQEIVRLKEIIYSLEQKLIAQGA